MEVRQEGVPTEEALEVLQDLNHPEALIEVAEVDFLLEVDPVEVIEVHQKEDLEADSEVGHPEVDPQEEEVAEHLEVVVEVV